MEAGLPRFFFVGSLGFIALIVPDSDCFSPNHFVEASKARACRDWVRWSLAGLKQDLPKAKKVGSRQIQ